MSLDCIVEPADASDWKTVVDLLELAGLPTGGASDQFPQAYLRVRTGRGVVVGVGAVERYGHYGLLRSVAVHSGFQQLGVGKQLVQQLQTRARTLGLTRVFLLTEATVEFFVALGFVPTPRDQAPSSILRSPQFASICPTTAHCLAWPAAP